jgi:quercetin dioxygenase-like cupin family protein
MAAAGDWYENTRTSELARVVEAPQDNDGTYLVADLWVAPGGSVMTEHVHDHLDERFTVLEGELAVLIDGVTTVAAAGETVGIRAGQVHDWRNAGATTAHVTVEILGAKAGRFARMIEAAFGLANTGRTNDRGLPSPLWLAALATEYADVMRVTRPPAAVQRLLFGPLAALARATGRDPEAEWLHGPGCPAQIPAPAGMEATAPR